jgi:polyadenylate-binding protein
LTIRASDSLLQRYGYVQFEKQEDANKAVETVNGMMLGGSAVSVEHYMPRSQRRKCVLALLFIVIFKGSPRFIRRRCVCHRVHCRADSWTNCYVKNIPLDWDNDKLRALFEPFGSITSCVVMGDPLPGGGTKSRGFGFVNFADHKEAEAAIAALNNKEVTIDPTAAEEGREVCIDV